MPKRTITQTLSEASTLLHDSRRKPTLDQLAAMCGEIGDHLSDFENDTDKRLINQLDGIAKDRGAASADSLNSVLNRSSKKLQKRFVEKRAAAKATKEKK